MPSEEKPRTEFRFTYRSMVGGAALGVVTYAVLKDLPSMLSIVKYGTWLAIVPM